MSGAEMMAASTIFTTMSQAAKSTPKIKAPALAPDPDSLESKRKGERDMAVRRSSGRASTIMSESDTLG